MLNFLFWQKRNNLGKDTLNQLGWSEIRKIEINSTRILPELEIHPTHILPEPYTPDPYLTRPFELTSLAFSI